MPEHPLQPKVLLRGGPTVRTNKQQFSSHWIFTSIALLSTLANNCLVDQIAIDCPAYLGKLFAEKDIIAKFAGDISSGNVKSIHHNCPEFLMKHGLLDATEYLFKEWFIPRKIDIVDKVRASVHYIVKEVDRTLSLASNFKKKQKVVPVFRWAQNFTHVLIHVKYTHRFDAPACLYTWGKNLTLSPTYFYFDILGIQAETPLDYELQFPLFKEIVPEESVEKSESVCRTLWKYS